MSLPGIEAKPCFNLSDVTRREMTPLEHSVAILPHILTVFSRNAKKYMAYATFKCPISLLVRWL